MKDYKQILREESEKEYFINLIKFLDEEYKTRTIFPKKNEIFNALILTPLDKTKVVILGQDPYHEENQAHGLAFSALPENPIPRSLQNIYTELKNDLNVEVPHTPYLEPWAKKGVLLLNTILTVRKGYALSHKDKGWEIFTERIIKEINLLDQKVVFMLWGNNARSYKRFLTNEKHLVLEAAHPSPLSAMHGFFGCKHFSKAETFLQEKIWSK